MMATFRTIVYAADKARVDELMAVKRQIANVYGKKFIQDAEKDLTFVNETIRENITIIIPPEGMKVEKVIEVARKAGVMYMPSEKANAV